MGRFHCFKINRLQRSYRLLLKGWPPKVILLSCSSRIHAYLFKFLGFPSELEDIHSLIAHKKSGKLHHIYYKHQNNRITNHNQFLKSLVFIFSKHDTSLSSPHLSEQHQKYFFKMEHSSQSKQDTVQYGGSDFEWQDDWQAGQTQHGSKELETNSTVKNKKCLQFPNQLHLWLPKQGTTGCLIS